ncbi:MAG TPA: hypothetical protein VMW52_03060, partial [Phycisphaerae bacterium]|nr:hypothetical protein [Phycisphaerae bacterium]
MAKRITYRRRGGHDEEFVPSPSPEALTGSAAGRPVRLTRTDLPAIQARRDSEFGTTNPSARFGDIPARPLTGYEGLSDEQLGEQIKRLVRMDPMGKRKEFPGGYEPSGEDFPHELKMIYEQRRRLTSVLPKKAAVQVAGAGGPAAGQAAIQLPRGLRPAEQMQAGQAALDDAQTPEEYAQILDTLVKAGYALPPKVAIQRAAGVTPKTQIQQTLELREAVARRTAELKQIEEEQGIEAADERARGDLRALDLSDYSLDGKDALGNPVQWETDARNRIERWRAAGLKAKGEQGAMHATDMMAKIDKELESIPARQRTEELAARKEQEGIQREQQAALDKEKKANQLEIAKRAEKRADDRLKELKGEMEKLEKDKEGDLSTVTDEQIADKRAEVDAARVDLQAASTGVDRLLAGKTEVSDQTGGA